MDQYISHRSWMYDRKYPGGRTIKARFKDGVEEFVAYAMSQDIVKSEGGIRCPCIKCMCGLIQSPSNVIAHLEKFGFMNDYYVWRHHGEQRTPNIITKFDVNMDASSSGARARVKCENFVQMQDMASNALGVNLSYYEEVTKINKKSSKGDNLHSQGSVGVSTHAQELIKKEGDDEDIVEIHKETHTKRSTGAYVDQWSETTQALYDDAVLNFLQEHPVYSCYEQIPHSIRRQIWLEVSEPETKKTKYAFGKLAPNARYENILHVPTPEEMSRLVALPPTVQAEIQRLTQELQTQREELDRQAQLNQERQEQMHEWLNEQIRRAMDDQRREIDAYFRQLLASTSRNAPNDHTDPPANEDTKNSD